MWRGLDALFRPCTPATRRAQRVTLKRRWGKESAFRADRSGGSATLSTHFRGKESILSSEKRI